MNRNISSIKRSPHKLLPGLLKCHEITVYIKDEGEKMKVIENILAVFMYRGQIRKVCIHFNIQIIQFLWQEYFNSHAEMWNVFCLSIINFYSLAHLTY